MDISFLISLVIYGIVALFGLIGAVCGAIRGFKRQVIRSTTVIISAVIAFFISSGLYPFCLSFIEGKTLQELVPGAAEQIGAYGILDSLSPELLLKLMAIPVGLIVLPVLFVVIFFIVSFILWIVHKILCGIFGFTRRNNNLFTRLLGISLGALQGVFVAAIVLLPAAGIMNFAEDTVKTVEDNYPEKMQMPIVELYENYSQGARDNVAFTMVRAAAGGVYNSLATFDIDGRSIAVTEISDACGTVLANVSEFFDADMFRLEENQKTALTDILESVEGNNYLVMILTEVVNSLGGAVSNGSISFGFAEPFGGFVEDYFRLLEQTNEEDLLLDVETSVDIYFLLSDANVFHTVENGGDLAVLFLTADEDGLSLFAKVQQCLAGNPRMNAVSASAVELAMAMLLEQAGVDTSAMETVNTVKGGINEALAISPDDYGSEAEYKAAVNEKIDTALKQAQIGLSEEETLAITDYVINNLEQGSTISDADLASFMAEYYNVRAD